MSKTCADICGSPGMWTMIKGLAFPARLVTNNMCWVRTAILARRTWPSRSIVAHGPVPQCNMVSPRSIVGLDVFPRSRRKATITSNSRSKHDTTRFLHHIHFVQPVHRAWSIRSKRHSFHPTLIETDTLLHPTRPLHSAQHFHSAALSKNAVFPCRTGSVRRGYPLHRAPP